MATEATTESGPSGDYSYDLAHEVQEGARRAASSVSQAVTASADELARRVRGDRG